jgi:hypothetical protein
VRCGTRRRAAAEQAVREMRGASRMLTAIVGQELSEEAFVADLDGERPVACRHEAGWNEPTKRERNQQNGGDQLTRASGERRVASSSNSSRSGSG